MSVSLWCEEEQEDAMPRAPWDPHASGERVLGMLLRVEQRYSPSALYVSLTQRQPQQREQLAKWALEVCCESSCEERVFPLALSLLDRFLSTSLALPPSPLCLAAACVLLASKLQQSEPLGAHMLCAAAPGAFLPQSLREMERVVLATLQWDVAAITPQDFFPHLLPAPTEKGASTADAEAFLSTLRRHGDTLVAMCICDARFLGMPPSLVAAAALNSAFRGLDDRGPQLRNMPKTLAAHCRINLAVLQYYTDMIEGALSERLRAGRTQQEKQHKAEKDGDVEEERASTPTDLQEVDF
ncbi:cyclin Dx [Paramormyrops kingsleyae]|uniref:Cyclin Dx n=1 Tax=Paramormyrops kingsleyae TaxID=1676925 RepID=A0A3B3QEU9_9TELE|nr:G1/S-specific cyclin-D2-like [Paramormyrops kingsleyae]